MPTKLLEKITAKQEGDFAEQLACDYLQNKHLRLITRNYRCRLGEIDLIMQDRDTLVFIEVRYRKNLDFGGAIASVDARKCAKLLATASHYLQKKRLTENVPCRFDVVTITGRGSNRVEWIKDAFQMD